MKSNLTHFSSMDHAFGIVLKNSSSNPKAHRLSPMLSSRSFIVLCFIFRTAIQFELILIKGVRCLDLFFFAYERPIVPAAFVEKTILSWLNYLSSFTKDQLTMFVRV